MAVPAMHLVKLPLSEKHQENITCTLAQPLTAAVLSKMYRENIGEEEILNELRVLLPRYAKEREDGEHFGDFVIRAGIIKATTDGTNFHD